MANFIDTFTGTNGTALTAHTSDSGHTWVVPPSGTSMILGGGRAYSANSFTVRNQTTATPTSADYTVEGDLYFASLVTSINGGITARDTGESTQNLYTLRYVRSTDLFRLDAIVAGSTSVLGSLAAAAAAGTTRHLKLTVDGTTISGWVDDVLVASVTHSGLTAAGTAGTYAGGAASSLTTGLHLDNFTQTDPVTNVTITATPAALTLAAPAPAITSETVVASTGPAAFTLAAPANATVTAGARVTAPAAALSATGPAPVVTAGATVAATTGALTFAASAPVVTAAAHVTIPAAQLTLAVAAPAVVGVRNATITAPPAALTIAAQAPSVGVVSASTVLAPAAALTYAAPVPVITATRHATITPPPAALTIIGGTPVITGGSKITAPPATLAVSTAAPTVFASTAATVAAVPAGLTWAAYPPIIIGGAVVVAPPALVTVGAPSPTLPNTWADITVSASLDPRRWTAALPSRTKTGTLSDRRWMGDLP